MTVAVLVKVNDGIVLATDSATTLPLTNGSHQVYNAANKVFQLHRRYPIGAMTWGLGGIGSLSIESFLKERRSSSSSSATDQVIRVDQPLSVL